MRLSKLVMQRTQIVHLYRHNPWLTVEYLAFTWTSEEQIVLQENVFIHFVGMKVSPREIQYKFLIKRNYSIVRTCASCRYTPLPSVIYIVFPFQELGAVSLDGYFHLWKAEHNLCKVNPIAAVWVIMVWCVENGATTACCELCEIANQNTTYSILLRGSRPWIRAIVCPNHTGRKDSSLHLLFLVPNNHSLGFPF